jgi:hypothetical protein
MKIVAGAKRHHSGIEHVVFQRELQDKDLCRIGATKVTLCIATQRLRLGGEYSLAIELTRAELGMIMDAKARTDLGIEGQRRTTPPVRDPR